MTKIVLASRNKHKIIEWQNTLSKFIDGVEMLSLDDVGVFGEIEENGETFKENARIKAEAAARSGYISVGEDSGLAVGALDGAPGVYSARYAGEHGDDDANNAKLLRELADKNDRSASFVCTIACIDKNGDTHYFVGETEGVIIDEKRGEGGFGYDPLFFFPALNKTFAELSREEKHEVSHRGNALRLLREELLI